MRVISSGFIQASGLLPNISLVAVALILGGCGKEPEQPTQQASQSQQVQQLVTDSGLSKEDIKAFAGSDKLAIGGKVANITLPQSEDEKHLFADFSCQDESECYGVHKFDKHIASKYPEIAQVKFRPPKDITDDKETAAHTRLDFRRGLYFAKEIKIADGTTLFDFLTKCSKNVSPFNWAEIAYDSNQKTYIGMQFFPVLRQRETGKEFEVDILLDRYGDRIEARSPLFSTSILIYSDFMERHGLECWPSQRPQGVGNSRSVRP